MFRIGPLLLTSALLQACVLLPFPVVPEEDNFADDRISWIRPGTTTRLEVVERMGEPVAVRKNGNLAVYGQARTVAGWFFGALWGSGGTMPIERKSLLLIEYQTGGIVSQVHLMRGDRSCTESGLCVEAEFVLEDTNRLMEHESNLVNVVVYLSEQEDRSTNPFIRSTRSCGVYLYSSGRDEFLAVKNSRIGVNAVVARGYISWFTEPGTISIQASRRDEWSSISFECPANDLRFVNLHIDGREHWNSPEITLDHEETGMAQVLARSRILH